MPDKTSTVLIIVILINCIVRIYTIQYDIRIFTVRSKLLSSQLNLPHDTDGRIQEKSLGDHMMSAEREPKRGSVGQSPHRGPGAEPLKLNAFFALSQPEESAKFLLKSVCFASHIKHS